MPRPHRPLGAVVRALSFLATILAALACVFAPRAFAEGSASLLQSGGSRPFLEFRDDVTAGSTVPRKTLVQVYAVPGDTILLASSANGVGRGAIRWRSPDGHSGTAPTTIGVIANRAREVAGPLPNLGGYAPYRLLVPPGQGGIWEIAFVSPDSTSRSDPPQLLVTAAWTQPTGVGYVCAWDVTVRNGSGFVIPGRAYTTQLAMNMGGLDATLSSQVYVLTRDGFRYRVDANGGQPFGFNWFANNKGFTDAAGTPLYKSVPLAGSHVHDPNSPDTPSDVTHKIFFNTPALDMPTTAPTPNGPTWLLLPSPLVPQVSNLTFTGVDGTLNQVGSGLGGTFRFTSTGNGNFSIRIDIDANGSYTDPVDRQLAGTAVAGTNTMFWDGYDGLGHRAGRSGNPSNVQAQVILQGGEIHFPYIDAESNVDGIVLERQNGANVPDFNVYYDDRALGGGAALPPTGENSSAGGHKWPRLFGDVRGMDTWTYVPGANVQIKLAIVIRDADLELLSKTHTPQPVVSGQPIQWTVVARNNGPDSVFAATVLDTIDSRVTGLSVVNTSHTGGTITSAAFTGPVFRAQFDLPPAGTATFVLAGTVGAAVSGALPNHAVALRGPDQGDPDDPTRIGAGNNGKRDTATVNLPAPDLALTKTHAGAFPIGQPSDYTLTVSNSGPGATRSATTVTDTLPAGLTFVAGTGTNWVIAANGPVVTATYAPAIAPGGNASFTLTVRPTLAAYPNVTNAAIVRNADDANPANDRASDPTAVTGAPDLAIDKRHTEDFSSPGLNTWTFVVTNVGTLPSIGSFAVHDTLANFATFVSGTGPGVTVWSLIGSRLVLAASSVTLAPGDSAILRMVVRVPAGVTGTLTNLAAVEGGGDSNPANNTDIDVVPVIPAPDLALAKAHGGPFAVDGQNNTYRFQVDNVGSAPTSGATTIRDTLPNGLTFVSGSGAGWTFAANGPVVTMTYAAPIAENTGTVCTILVDAQPAALPKVDNFASVNTPGDHNPSNDRAEDLATVAGPPADLSLTKTHTGPFPVAGYGTWNFVVRNHGGGPTTATITVSDTLPAGTHFVSGSGLGWSIFHSGSVVVASRAALLAPDSSSAFSITVGVEPAAFPSVTNFATVASQGAANPADDRASDTAPVIQTPDVALRKSHAAPFLVNAQGTWRFDVTNVGGSPTIGPITIRDTLPAGTTFVSGSGSGWAISNVGQIVTMISQATLAGGEGSFCTVVVFADTTGYPQVTNAATASTPGDLDSLNDRALDPTPVNHYPDLSIVKQHTTVFRQGATGSWTIQVINHGRGPTRGGIVVRDTLPEGVTFSTGGAPGWSLTTTDQIVTAQYFRVLAPGESSTFAIGVAIDSRAPATLVNYASVEAIGDTLLGDNRSRDVVSVVGIPDLTLDKRHTQDFVAPGIGTYTFVVNNLGPVPATTSFVVIDTLPSGLSPIAGVSGPGWSSSLNGSIVTLTYAPLLGVGDSAVARINVQVLASAVPGVTNAATLVGGGDRTPDDNRDVDPTLVIGAPDLRLTKTAATALTVGQQGSYRFDVTNIGVGPTTGAITIRDTLPTGTTFVSGAGGGWAFADTGQVVTMTYNAALAPNVGLTCTIVVNITAPAFPLLVNSATVRTAGDTNPLNDRAFSRTAVNGAPGLVLTKTHAAPFVVGSPATWLFTVRNQGQSATRLAFDVRDTLPAGTTFVSGTGTGWTFTNTGSIVDANYASALGVGSTTSFSITVLVDAAALPSVTNVATLEGGGDPDTAGHRASDTAPVSGAPDLQLQKRHTGSFTVGLPGSYRFDVQNLGNVTTSGTVTIRDTLPAGLTFTSGTGVGWTFANTGQVVTMTSSAPIAPQGSTFCTIVVDVGIAASPAVTNAATVATAGDSNPGNDRAVDPTVVSALPDLALTKTHVGTFSVGRLGQYRFVVRNVGPGPTLGQVAIVDTLPAGITFEPVQEIASPWRVTSNPPVVNATTQQVIAAGDSLVLTFFVRVGEAAIPLATNTATVSTVGDPNDGNDRAIDRVDVAFRKSLVVDKTASPTEVEIGDVVDYAVRLRNDGDVSFPDVRLDDRIPAGFVYVRGSARLDGAPFADPAGAPGPQLAFAIDTVRAGVTRLLTYRLAVGAGAATGPGRNVAVATSPGGPTVSPPGVATVEVRGGLFAPEGIIAGKLFVDCGCDSNHVQGHEELGIPGVRVTLEDGTSAITDAEGKYHFAGQRPRLHVLRVDRATLPPGAKLVPLSNRAAGDGLSQFVDLHAGEFFRADFAEGSRDTSVLRFVKQRRERGEVTSALHESPEGGAFLSATPTRDDAHELLLRVPDRAPADPMSVLGAWAADDSAHRATPARVTYETDAGQWVNPQTLVPPARDADPVAPGLQKRLPAGATFADATALMALPDRAGDVHVRITDDAGRSDSATVHVTPAPRGFFLAGLAEARLDLRSKKDGALGGMVRDGFMDRLLDASFDSDSGKVHGAARGALYGTGAVGKAGLLTLRYDSEADPSRRLFRDIRPGEGYDVFGDASLTEFAAQSRSRLYARFDHDRSYAMFGDLTTPGSNARQLGAFSRSLNGGVVHLENRAVALGGFASRGRAHQVLDERAGLGLSGPYALSRTDGVQGSERVEILTRDRNQPSRILRIEPQTRFADYTLEPFTGRLWFRRPIPSVDADLNPVSVRVTYETEAGTDDYWVAGGDAGLTLGRALHVGAALSRDDDPAHARDLASVDATLTPIHGVTLTGEFARTDTARGGLDHADRDAIRGALDVTRDAFTARAWAMRADRAFDNASSGVASGREELGGSARVKLYTGGSAFATALRSRDLVSGGRRDGLDAGLSQKLTGWLSAEAAYRTSEETTVPSNATAPVPTSNETHSLRGRLTADVPGIKRATAFGEFEQDVDHSTQRRGAFGAELPVAPRTRLYVRHENIASFGGPFALNGDQQQATTVFGIASDELREGHVFTEYRARDAFSGRDAQAAFGLRNRWSVAKGLRLDGSFERLSVLRTGTTIPVAGSGEATTAITGGIEWTGDPLWKATSRLEWRRGDGHEQWLSSAGLARKLSRDWSALGDGHWLQAPGGGRIDALGRFGVAYRQTDDNRLNWLARYEVGRRRADAVVLGNAGDERITHVISTHANWQPVLPWTLDGQLAARWLRQSSNALLTRTDAQLAGGRARWEFRRGWDAGLDARGMFSRHFGEKQFGTGLELGHTLARDVRVAAGFNVFGFRSDGLAGDDVTDAGPFLHLGWKFGETLFGAPANGGEAK